MSSSAASRHPLVTHKGKVLRIHGARLDQKLISPTVQGIKTLAICDIKTENAAIGSTVECDTQRLETFLSGGVPQLHCHQSIIDKDFFCEEVGALWGVRDW